MIAIGAVNYVAVLAAAIVAMAVGMVWYSPALFVKRWMKLTGVSEKQMKQSMGMPAAVGFVTLLISAFVIAHFVSGMVLTDALMAGLLFWLGLLFPKAASQVIWEKRSMELFWINTGHDLAIMLLMSATIVLVG